MTLNVNKRSVTQDWVNGLSFMQQSVLLTAVRGPDGMPKYGPTKYLLRWYRRCILLCALNGEVLKTPYDPRGGSFTGPSFDDPAGSCMNFGGWQQSMDDIVSKYLKELDMLPHHFQMHLLHAVEILGYKHPDRDIRIWWNTVYHRLVKDLHLSPETEEDLDFRLGDNEGQWRSTADHATQA